MDGCIKRREFIIAVSSRHKSRYMLSQKTILDDSERGSPTWFDDAIHVTLIVILSAVKL
jgi:hypothetical protein